MRSAAFDPRSPQGALMTWSVPRVLLAGLVLSAGLALASRAQAVNLLPNDSFELYVNCPTNYSNTPDCVAWLAPTTGTSDYHNSCANFPPFAPDVPTNPMGFQFARTGEAYCGFIVHSATPDYREYIEAPLNATLLPGVTYTVSFWVSLADNADASVDRLGAYFSVGPVGFINNWNPLPFTPQIESPAGTFLDDKTNWMQVSGSF